MIVEPSIVLREGEGERPLFLVHDVTGEVFCFYPLARALPASLPVIGLQLKNPNELSSISVLAARHVETIRSIQPQGPYRLAGHSFGGVIAYEIAQQLLGDDQPVEFLGLIDSYAPGISSQTHDEISEVAALAEQQQHRQPGLRARDLNELRKLPDVAPVLAHYKLLGLLPEDTRNERFQRWIENGRAALRTYGRYCPERLQLRAALLTAEHPEAEHPAHGWRPLLSDGMTVRTVGGTHHAILQAAHAERLAAEIVDALRVPAATPKHRYSPLITLHDASAAAPKVFCVPGAGATITCFMPLANAFGSSASVFGFQPRGLDGAMPPYTSVARAATVYVAAMRAMQRNGPYRLIGHSFGGWIAFEMAGLLLAAGESVLPIVLLDSEPPSLERTYARHYSRVGTILKLANILEVSTGKRMSLSRDDLESRDAKSQNFVLAKRMRDVGLLPRTATEDAVWGLLRVLSANLNAAYVPSNGVDAPVQLIRALEAMDTERDIENLEIERENLSSRWENHAADLRSLDVPGNHMTMLSHPNVDTIVKHVRHLWGEEEGRVLTGSSYALGVAN